ncbi:hypothetical protein ACFFHI_05430 [Streptomyces palmae]|uniref:hypothetical protein n=2 Tax=Streptomyces palmae TaxID=1701085 RepID=UPI0035F0AE6A
MTPEGVVALLDQMYAVMRSVGMTSGDIMHTVVQLREALVLQLQGFSTAVNEKVVFQVRTAQGQLLDWTRSVDVIARKAGELAQHIEVKTGSVENALPSVNAAYRQGEANLQLLKDLALGATGTVQNIWKIYSAPIAEMQPFIEKRMGEWTEHMRTRFNASDAEIEKAIRSFRFEDALGDAIEFTWGAEGPIAHRAAKAARSSPDFGPAMEVLFGPSGKMADAAHDAALGVNLEPAEKAFEKKLADGVGTALTGAGDKGAAAAAESLSKRISSGATELGNLMTSIPQLYDSVTKLGEAWDKPNKSTKDYMDLLSAAGGMFTQAGQVIQAFTGATELASAANAVFNAIMAMNPIYLVVIAVIALIAVIVLLIVYWDEVSAALRDNPWLAVAAVLLGVIGIIIVVIAYWDEIKLAVLIAANFISIQVQMIGQVFTALGTLIGQVWAWIVATAQNAGIGVINTFIAAGTAIQNFFIGVVNSVLGMYNKLADSAAGQAAGLARANLIPQVEMQARLIPPKEVPPINVTAALTPKPVKGGLEGQIAAQEEAVAKAREADEARRAKAAAPPAAAPAGPPAPAGAPPAGPAGAVPPAIPGLPGGAAPPGPPLPAGVPGAAVVPEAAGVPGAAGVRPPLPPVPAVPAAAPGGPDQSVHVEGGITVNINAERLEADAARLLSDEIIQRIQERLATLRSEQDFRAGTRAPAPA